MTDFGINSVSKMKLSEAFDVSRAVLKVVDRKIRDSEYKNIPEWRSMPVLQAFK